MEFIVHIQEPNTEPVQFKASGKDALDILKREVALENSGTEADNDSKKDWAFASGRSTKDTSKYITVFVRPLKVRGQNENEASVKAIMESLTMLCSTDQIAKGTALTRLEGQITNTTGQNNYRIEHQTGIVITVSITMPNDGFAGCRGRL